LRPLSITTEDIWWIDKSLKGYVFKHFDDAFVRYLPDEGGSEPREREKADKTGTSEPFQTARPEADLAVEKHEKSANGGPPRGLADEKGGTGAKTQVRTAIVSSDGMPLYTGPVVPVPEQPPDTLDEHGAPVVEGTVASVPFMLTKERKRRLRVCGYSDEQIAHMTPQEAHDILEQLAPQSTNGNSELGLSQERIRELHDWRDRWLADGEKPEDVDDAMRSIIREELDDQSMVEQVMKLVLAV
jgi:hypothetical protein